MDSNKELEIYLGSISAKLRALKSTLNEDQLKIYLETLELQLKVLKEQHPDIALQNPEIFDRYFS